MNLFKSTTSLMAGLLFTFIGNEAFAATQYSDTIKFRFATKAEAQELVVRNDVFTSGWSEFDVVSRLRKPTGTKEELLALKKAGVSDWTEKEKQIIWQDMLEFNKIIRANGYRLPLPEEVVLVKSNMKDEGDAAGYTQANWIALLDNYIERASANRRRELLLHELSHVLTRNSFAYKKRLYKALGFTVVKKGLEYPEELVKARISNPDIAAYDSYGPFTIKERTVNGRTEKAKVENCAMYLYADRPYTTGRFFEYVKVAFVPYDKKMNPKRDANGKLVIYHMSDLADFYERVGKNTDYIIHPEEILAENFVSAYLQKPDMPTPDLQQRVLKVIKGK